MRGACVDGRSGALCLSLEESEDGQVLHQRCSPVVSDLPSHSWVAQRSTASAVSLRASLIMAMLVEGLDAPNLCAGRSPPKRAQLPANREF